MRRAVSLLIVSGQVTVSILAATAAGKVQRVRFARGRTTAVLNGAVVRGTQDRYILGARAGQTMIVDQVNTHE
jgi:hypothetical protein